MNTRLTALKKVVQTNRDSPAIVEVDNTIQRYGRIEDQQGQKGDRAARNT